MALSWHGVVVDSFREFRRRQPDVELVVHHLLSVHQVEAVLSDRLDVGFGHHHSVAQGLGASAVRAGRIAIGSAQRASLTRLKRIRLRDLRNMPFVGFQRWANPAFYDELMQACARGGLSAPRIVQEATDRDTQLGLVQCRIGIAWQTESMRWQCPRGIALLPVVDMNIRVPYNLIWKKDNSSPLLHKFVAQVAAEEITTRK